MLGLLGIDLISSEFKLAKCDSSRYLIDLLLVIVRYDRNELIGIS